MDALLTHRAEQKAGEAALPAWADDQQFRAPSRGEQCGRRVVVDRRLSDLDVGDLADHLVNEGGKPRLTLLRAAIKLDLLRPWNRLPFPERVNDVEIRAPPPRLPRAKRSVSF